MKSSESIAKLAKALCAAQGEIRNPANTADNPFFKSKYAPLPDILNLIRPIMHKHGLSFVQMPTGNGESVQIPAILLHESGEWMEMEPCVVRPEKNTAQGIGSAITYGRRYQVSAVLGISSEDDDDGNQERRGGQKQERPKSPPTKSEPASDTKATKAQHGKIHALANELELDHEAVSKGAKMVYKVESMSDLTREQASDMIERMERKIAEKRTEEQQEFGKEMAGKK